jgi:hypothetical protein
LRVRVSRRRTPYQRLQDDKLTALLGVLRMTSTLVMKRIVYKRSCLLRHREDMPFVAALAI